MKRTVEREEVCCDWCGESPANERAFGMDFCSNRCVRALERRIDDGPLEPQIVHRETGDWSLEQGTSCPDIPAGCIAYIHPTGCIAIRQDAIPHLLGKIDQETDSYDVGDYWLIRKPSSGAFRRMLALHHKVGNTGMKPDVERAVLDLLMPRDEPS